MKQAIPGVAPPELGEVTIMIVWPSIAASPAGCFVGRLCGMKAGFGKFFTVGKLNALLCIPIAVTLFALSLSPWDARRYKLTNRRIVVLKRPQGVEVESVPLDGFDSIEVRVREGQEWYPAGDLIFRKGPVEVLTLPGVPRPETFRQTCLKAHLAYVAVKAAAGKQAAI
jgi:hypothetical protein